MVALEIALLIVMRSWNSEILSVITGLTGPLFGALLERKGVNMAGWVQEEEEKLLEMYATGTRMRRWRTLYRLD